MEVLVVDDDMEVRQLLQAELQARGWTVRVAADGVAALESARQSAPDICVSDILMPRMDGYALCRAWKADESLAGIPFVFYSATYTSDEDESFALALGADAFIVKPKEADEFVRLLEGVLARAELGAMEASRPAEREEAVVLREYNERLVQKLEDKVRQLEEANAVLAASIEMLEDQMTAKEKLIERLSSTAESGDAPASASGAQEDSVTDAECMKRLERAVEERTRELSAANERLREAAVAKSRFVAKMGLAMRNKLNSIIGFSGILLQGIAGELDGEQRKHVDMVYRAGQELLALVNDVVDLSKIEAGLLDVTPTRFELLGFLEDVIGSFEATAKESDVEIGLETEVSALPVLVDQSKLDQVVRNLLSNAIKFAPGGRVTVEVGPLEDGSHFYIRVRDTGPGMSPAELQSVFDEFVKYDKGGAKQGTGLGLALTRKLCELMGGSVSARSVPGEGSIFTVLLPLECQVQTEHESG